ncbi:hypothetical protein BDY24DRAFT_388320 [Mrakia frigida]|uniref:uncharacterized protein n=1 Tax=Mrakia frigida TaxID=29902 RepID=UPI003FCBEF93
MASTELMLTPISIPLLLLRQAIASPSSPSPSTSSSDLELSPSSSASSKGLITPSSSSFGPLPILKIADFSTHPSSIIEDAVIPQEKEVVVETNTLGLQPFLDVEPIASSPPLEQPTTLISPPTVKPTAALPSIPAKPKSRNARNKKVQPKKVKKSEVVVPVAPPSPPAAPVEAANKKSSKARSRKGRKKSKTIPAISSVAPQVVVVVEEKQAQSKDSPIVLVDEVEVVASPLPSSLLPPPPPPRFNRPRSSTSPTTPHETVLAQILVQYQDPDYSSSLDDELTSVAIPLPLPFFLDLAAKAAPPSTFSTFLDIDESTFSSLPSAAVPMARNSFPFELNEDGKIVPWYEPQSFCWSDEEEEEEEVESELSMKKGLRSRFTGFRHILSEEGTAMAFYDSRKTTTKSFWERAKVGGSPLRWGWVGEE